MTQIPENATIKDRLGPVQAGLRSDLEVTRHLFRGQPEYVVRDPLTFQSHKFSQHDYQILIALSNTVSFADVFAGLVKAKKIDPDQEEDFYQFILALHRLSFLNLPFADNQALFERYERRQQVARWQRLSGILFLRVPLINPDAFLDRTANLFRPLFSRTALVVWMAVMLGSLWILVQRWDSFMSPMHSILVNSNLLFLWVALIGLKIVHEFGHAYACKIFGGKVPEMGAFFIAFTPCAYVDASAAWGFPSVRQRVVVSLAGMYVESIIAAMALFVWSWTEHPLIGSCAHQVVVLASVVTIGFNINPLMRYDGYYVFSDLTGIPNLRQRGIESVQAVGKRLLLGIRTATQNESRCVRTILFSYGISSVVYKVILVLGICAMVAMKFYLLGIGLAIMFLITSVGGALKKMVVYLWRSQETQSVRGRAVAVSLVVLVLLPIGVAAVPVPRSVVIPGIVETEDDRVIHAQTAGFLQAGSVTVGSTVEKEQTLCHLKNIVTECRLDEAAAQTEVVAVRYRTMLSDSPHDATAARMQWIQSERELAQARQERDQLAVTSPISGTVVRIVGQNDTGKFVKVGEPLATVAGGRWCVRALVTAEQIADIKPTVGQAVRVRLGGDEIIELTGTILEVAVKGSRKSFSPALTQIGGGDIAVNTQSLQADSCLFELTIEFAEMGDVLIRHGMRAMVTLRALPQTCGVHWSRRLRQFLNKLRLR